MAKKKGKVRPRNRKKPGIPFLSVIKRMFIWSFMVLICFIGLLYLYNYLYPSSSKQSVAVEQKVFPANPVKRPKDESQKQTPTSSDSENIKIPTNAEIPEFLTKRNKKEQVIRHEGYTVSYNSDYKIANWVAYELTAEEAKSKKAERSNKFVPDPMVKGASAINEDYTRTGYDRGHLAPAGDMKWSAKSMRESFYLSNICPQIPALNRGIWKDLEEQSRLWAMDNGSLLITTGPVMGDTMKRMGKNGVGIPDAFYKVICYTSGKKLKGIAFIFENRDYKNVSLKTMAIPIDSVEAITGINFFSSIPEKMQKEMESTVDFESWSF